MSLVAEFPLDPDGGVANSEVRLPIDKGPGKDSDNRDGQDGMSRCGRHVSRGRKGCGWRSGAACDLPSCCRDATAKLGDSGWWWCGGGGVVWECGSVEAEVRVEGGSLSCTIL